MHETIPDPRRRRLLDWLLGGSALGLAGSILYPVLRFLSPPEIPQAPTGEVEAGTTSDPELLEKGFKIVRFGAEPVLLVRLGEREFRAFSATCTHLDCVVEYQKNERRIWCNCHNGEYDLTGRNVAGPPPKPLAAFQVHLTDSGPGRPETIVISRS